MPKKRALDQVSGLDKVKIIIAPSAEEAEEQYAIWCRDTDLHRDFNHVTIQERLFEFHEDTVVLAIFHRLNVKD